MSGFGVFLAIATAFSWALGCVVHTTASRVVGIPAVMLIRQPLASVVLGIFCLVMCLYPTFSPSRAEITLQF